MIRMILDTDTYNEVDDQFALVYALLSPEAVKVVAIHAAPFHNKNSSGPKDGMERSYQEILRLMKLMGRETDGVVFRGADRYMGSKETPVECEAVDNLIKLALTSTKEDPLYVVAIGAPTNVSSAIVIEPKIKESIRVIWLGGTTLDWPDAGEFNQQQDIAASQVLFDSGVDLVQIPCHNVASHLKVGIPELRACMGTSNVAKALTDLVAEAIDNNPAKTRVIWDISAIAYVVIPDTVRTYKIHSPILHGRPNLAYSSDRRRHMIDCAYYLDRDAIFMDMYNKIKKLK
ncbi:MAG: nucleoside hydrolase [Clostridiales bacterium]|nr:nucleoside hydrolase [Clostridiales bacterium]